LQNGSDYFAALAKIEFEYSRALKHIARSELPGTSRFSETVQLEGEERSRS
jgi:hypothetical protein